MKLINATPKQLRKAADIQERIQSLQDELNQVLLELPGGFSLDGLRGAERRQSF